MAIVHCAELHDTAADREPLILIIDNYDSFTYNLVQCLGRIGLESPSLRHDFIIIVRNDEKTVRQLTELRPDYLIVSPGPCTPRESGVSNDAIRSFAGRIPILGVCLGHQCIADAYGTPVVRAGRIMHGKTSEVFHDGRTVYAGLPNPFTAMRYHSLAIEPGTLHRDFEITAWTDQNECMGLRHRRWPLEGVQFHPESFLTVEGHRLLTNFLKLAPTVDAASI